MKRCFYCILVLFLCPFFLWAEHKTEINIKDVSPVPLLKRQKWDWGLQFGGGALDGLGLQAVLFPVDRLSLSCGAGTTFFTGNLSAGAQYYTSSQKKWSPYLWGRYSYMASIGLLEALGDAFVTILSALNNCA